MLSNVCGTPGDVLDGILAVQFGDEVVELGPGDFCTVPAATRCEIAWMAGDGSTRMLV
jgi:hypothetical protein